MQINQTNLVGLNKGFKTLFVNSMTAAQAQSQWQRIAMRTPSSNLEEVYNWLGSFPRMKEFLGEVNIKNIAANTYTVANKEFSSTVAVKQVHVESDNYGLYNNMFEMAGYSATTHKDEIVAALLNSGFTNKDYTGKAFFDVDKKHNPQDAKSSKFTNKGTKELAASTFEAAVAQIKGLKNDEGQPFGVGVKLLLVVPPALEHVAKRILNAELINGGETNVNKGTAELLVWPWLTSNTQWFLLEVGMPIKPLLLQTVKDTELTGITNPESDHVFKYHEFLYQAYGHYNSGYALPQLAWGSTGVDAA